MKIKIERSKREKALKKKKERVVSVGKHWKRVLALWILLFCSLIFGIYKNFTAIDQHTTHEKVVIKEKVLNTSGIENFTIDFAKEYFSWKNDELDIEKRMSDLAQYLTEEGITLSQDMIRADIPTSSEVESVKILDVEKKSDEFTISFSISQRIVEGKRNQMINTVYRVRAYKDKNGGYIITSLPTMIRKQSKAKYEEKHLESDSTIDVKRVEEMTGFLETFFTLYPTASEKELRYYIDHDVLNPINYNLKFKEIVSPIYHEKGKSIQATLVVKYIDDTTKTISSFQYTLVLQKEENWKIIDNKV